MSEEGGTRRTTRSLARRLSTDSISPPASAATPTKRPRAARVSALSAIPETKSAKTPTTRRSRRLSTSSDVSETTEEVITKTSTPIAEKRRSRRLSIDLEEANAQRSTAVSNVPIVEVIEEEEDINILAMKEENRKSSVVDEFAVKQNNSTVESEAKQKEVDVPVTDLDSNKLNEELVGENIAKADTSKSSKSEGVDNILKTDKECSVVIETRNVVVDVKNSSLNKEIENETPKKTIAMKQSPKTDLPEPMEIDVTDHNTSHADEDEIKNTQQTLNISYSSDSSSNVSTRSKSKVLLRISTSTDDLTKDSDASDNKKEDQDLGSAKEYNISTRSRKSVNDSVTKDLNKSAEKTKLENSSSDSNISTRSRSKLNISSKDDSKDGLDNSINEKLDSLSESNTSNRSKSKINSPANKENMDENLSSVATDVDLVNEDNERTKELSSEVQNEVLNEMNESKNKLNISTKSKSKSNISVDMDKDLCDHGQAEKQSISDKDICASNTDKVEKNTSGEVDATVDDQCNSNILTRSRSKLNVTDDINKSTSDLIPMVMEVDMGNESTNRAAKDLNVHDEQEYAEFEKSLNSSNESKKLQNSSASKAKCEVGDEALKYEVVITCNSSETNNSLTETTQDSSKQVLENKGLPKKTLCSENELNLAEEENDLSCNEPSEHNGVKTSDTPKKNNSNISDANAIDEHSAKDTKLLKKNLIEALSQGAIACSTPKMEKTSNQNDKADSKNIEAQSNTAVSDDIQPLLYEGSQATNKVMNVSLKTGTTTDMLNILEKSLETKCIDIVCNESSMSKENKIIEEKELNTVNASIESLSDESDSNEKIDSCVAEEKSAVLVISDESDSNEDPISIQSSPSKVSHKSVIEIGDNSKESESLNNSFDDNNQVASKDQTIEVLPNNQKISNSEKINLEKQAEDSSEAEGEFEADSDLDYSDDCAKEKDEDHKNMTITNSNSKNDSSSSVLSENQALEEKMPSNKDNVENSDTVNLDDSENLAHTVSDESEDESVHKKEYLKLDSDSDSSDYIEKEAKDMGKDYESYDSMDENEKDAMRENDFLEAEGESLHSSCDNDDEVDEYENDSFCVSSESETQILEGVSDDLDSRSSSGLSDLSQSQKSKEKYNAKQSAKIMKQKMILNISSDEDEDQTSKPKHMAKKNLNIIMSDSDDERIQSQYDNLLKTLNTEHSNDNDNDKQGLHVDSSDKAAESKLNPDKNSDKKEDINKATHEEILENEETISMEKDVPESIENEPTVVEKSIESVDIKKADNRKKAKKNIVDPNLVDVSKIQATCEQILNQENEKKQIHRKPQKKNKLKRLPEVTLENLIVEETTKEEQSKDSSNSEKKMKKPQKKNKLKRLPEVTLESLIVEETSKEEQSKDSSNLEKKMKVSENLDMPSTSTAEDKNVVNISPDLEHSVQMDNKEKQIESDVPLNTLNEIGNKTNNKKSKKDTDIEERCKATTSFKVSSNNIKRNLDSDPALESELGFKVKKINSSTVETSQVGCTTSFKVETSREYWRSVNSAIRSELLNYKENILLKGQIKRQKKGMIYSYRNKEVARASRR